MSRLGTCRRPTLLAIALGAAFLIPATSAGAGIAQAPPPPPSVTSAAATTTTGPPTTVETPQRFPLLDRPNSGRPPERSTDFGGWVQFAVFGGIMLAVGGIIGAIVRESRRKQGDRRPVPQSDRTSTRSEPVADNSENRPESSARQ